MKYIYSILIIMIGFFAIPAVFDFSGHVADHLRLMGNGKDADDAAPAHYARRIQDDPTVVSTSVSKPTDVRFIKE